MFYIESFSLVDLHAAILIWSFTGSERRAHAFFS